jgi:hypothetical protein
LHQFKKNLKLKLQLQYKNKILLSSPKKAYLNNLAKLGLEPTASDGKVSDESDDQPAQLQRLPTLEASIDNRKRKVREKLRRMKRDLPGMTTVDSLVESAYDSKKNLEWGKVPRGGLRVRNPNPSLQSLD